MRKTVKMTTLVLLAALLLTACSKGNNGGAGNSASGSAQGSESTASAAGPDNEPVTLTFWSAQMASNAPSGIQEDPVSKQIEKELNIKIDMETHPADDKLAALLATADLKDIMVVNQKYAEQMKDLVIDMEPLLEKYGPDIAKNVPPETIAYNKDKLGGGALKFLSLNINQKPARPDPVWGEIGIAVCVNRPGQNATEGEIADFLGPKIPRYKMPKRFLFWEALPKSGYGKVPKRLVKDELEKRGELDFLKGKAS